VQRDGIARHRTHDQRAFKAQIDAAAFLRQTFTQRDEEKRRADSNRSSENRDEYAPPTDFH